MILTLRCPGVLAHPVTHLSPIGWGDEATVDRNKAAAVQGLGRDGAEMLQALGWVPMTPDLRPLPILH